MPNPAGGRDTVFENALNHLAGKHWNVFVYYPLSGLVVFPEAVARRLNCEPVTDRRKFCTAPAFMRPQDIARYERLFTRIDDGQSCVSESFLDSELFSNQTVVLTTVARDRQNRVTAAVGHIVPQIVEDTSVFLSGADRSTAAEGNPILQIAGTLADRYYAVYRLNLPADTYTCLQDKTGFFSEQIGRSGRTQAALRTFVQSQVSPEDRERMTQFADTATLAGRLSDTGMLCADYRRLGVGHSRGTFQVLLRDAQGRATDVLFTAETTDGKAVPERHTPVAQPIAAAAVTEADDGQPVPALPAFAARLAALLDRMIITAYSFDLVAGTLTPLRVPAFVQALRNGETRIDVLAREMPPKSCAPFSVERMTAFLDPSTMQARLRKTPHVDCDFRSRVNGQWFRASIIASERDAGGTALKAIFAVTQLDDAVISEHQHNLDNRRYLEELFTHVPGGLALFSSDGTDLHVLFVSDFCKQVYGRDLTGLPYGLDPELVHPDDLADYAAARRKLLSTHLPVDFVFRARDARSGHYIWMHVNAVARPEPDGNVMVIAMYSDISEQKNREFQYKVASEHDPLTGLRNRTRVYDDCRRLLREHPETQFAMMHLDIRQFRLYNAFFGEKAGDRLLCDIADMFRRMDRDYDFWSYGRVDADVFCVFFPIDRNKYQVHLQMLLTALRNYRDDYLIEPAVGIYTVTDRTMPIEAMFARATVAAKASKSGSERAVTFYTDAMEAEVANTQVITNEMQNALETGQFAVYLQPKVSLSTGGITGSEALVRWIHPAKGLVPPNRFIPVFEKNGFITKLDRFMWEAVCRQLRARLDAGKRVLPVSVNVSRISMYSQTTVPFLKKLVQKYGIAPKLLELELTESALMDDPEEMERRLTDLRAFGFHILIDDFGKGYSSLNTLRDLPADVLKLDIGFLPRSLSDRRACAVVAAVLSMSRRLGLSVVAEGVETEEQAQFLREEGCPFAQGYLFARPMPAAEFEAQLDSL